MKNLKAVHGWAAAALFAAAVAAGGAGEFRLLPAAVTAFAEAVPEEETALAEAVTEEETGEGNYYSMVRTPFYFRDLEDPGEVPLYFINDVMDLPYIDLTDAADLMVSMLGDQKGLFTLSCEWDGPTYLLTRETGFSMLVDFDQSQILFDDYDGFVRYAGDRSLLDKASELYTGEDGGPALIEKIERGSFDRYGKSVELDLAAYHIGLYWSGEDDLYLVPLQLISDFLVTPTVNGAFLFGGDAVYFGNPDDFGFNQSEPTPFGAAYLGSGSDGTMSSELAEFSYAELCLALDNLYGLKEIHDFESFDDVFANTGYKNALLSSDPNVKDGALYEFISYYVDDLHSVFESVSYLTEQAATAGGDGLARRHDAAISDLYFGARGDAAVPVESYQEVGNTAYVTFDSFHMDGSAKDYFDGAVPLDPDPAEVDTAALVIYAHQQITREDSPIENVVLDLSLNGGGELDSGIYTAAWFLGQASVSIRSSLTGAISTGTYRVDVDLNGVIDENDTLSGRGLNLYCLIGPYSFSCGNLVPSLLKSAGTVTLIGKTSGGGSCAVMTLSTAHGALMCLSSPYRMSQMQNGSYYDTDTGIEPDYVIAHPENMYDREKLTQYINGLF